MSAEMSVDIVWEPASLRGPPPDVELGSLDYWDYSIELDCLRGPEDLQLAAELGKTLLERNKELENCIKQNQCTIDDQAQEIEYMKKQTAALREVNDSRLKIYEQLEVSIQELERANHRLAVENSNDKKLIKSQCFTIDTLENRLEEQQKKYDELNTRYEALLQGQPPQPNVTSGKIKTVVQRDSSIENQPAASPRRLSTEMTVDIQQLAAAMASDEDVARLVQQLHDSRTQRAREQKRAQELQEQLDTLLQEHAQMEEQLNLWKVQAQDMKNLQDEINTLEEVRQGHLCGRCLRVTDTQTPEDISAMLEHEEDDEMSLAESLADSLRDVDTTLQELESGKPELPEDKRCNQYRELVEKYEALLKVQQQPSLRRKPSAPCLSLQEELQLSGEFAQSDCELGARRKPFSGTPTDFSEAETSSSGFSDETSNKATQTEGRPGALLCSIADGEDRKFSIYDDSSSFESHFHKTPEYRKLFSEMFEVLKRAAVAKDEGCALPLLEGPPGAPAAAAEDEPAPSEAPSEATDDARSVASLAVSSVASEPVFRVHTPVLGRRGEEARAARRAPAAAPGTPAAAPREAARRQPLEYLSVQVRRKSKKGGRRSGAGPAEGPSTPDVIPTANPRVTQLRGGGRRRFRLLGAAELAEGAVWNGNTAHFYPSKSPRGRRPQSSSFEGQEGRGEGAKEEEGPGYKPGTVSEEVAKLRRLEMSYAEALRMPNKSKPGGPRPQRKQQQQH